MFINITSFFTPFHTISSLGLHMFINLSLISFYFVFLLFIKMENDDIQAWIRSNYPYPTPPSQISSSTPPPIHTPTLTRPQGFILFVIAGYQYPVVGYQLAYSTVPISPNFSHNLRLASQMPIDLVFQGIFPFQGYTHLGAQN